MMKGFRTLLINGAVVVGTAALTWAVGINWSEYVSPTVAMLILAGANVGLRLVTDTAVGTK
jgi:hypothetical protein